MYEGTWDSVRTHAVPDWYDDAKLGVFLHWGPYSVPGWAPRVPDIQELLLKAGPRRMLRENPYAEWYLNTMRIPGSPTARHHTQVYGDDYPYDNFVKTFDDATAGANLDTLAGLCVEAGARYVVLTTKHHDGFALWPSAVRHPVKGEYHARRDVVGDLAAAVRERRLRMGLYYSGGYDWSYNGARLRGAADMVLAAPAGEGYRTYATAHVRELIDRYAPSVLWNDISWPAGGNLAELFAHYYNRVPDGVINDRWREVAPPTGVISKSLMRAGGRLVELMWPWIPARRKRLTFPSPQHCDFRTPEYETLQTVSERKWEMCRGVGRSFGANRGSRPRTSSPRPS
jgi:alpha-L-fucosidase